VPEGAGAQLVLKKARVRVKVEEAKRRGEPREIRLCGNRLGLLILEEESPESARVLVVVVNQADKPPITCDTLQKFPRGRAARVEQRPLGPDIEGFLLRGVSGLPYAWHI
jgi:hypothetical protein